jgi:hypothetical protein
MRLTYTATAPSSLPAHDDAFDRIAGGDVLKHLSADAHV